MIRLSRSAGAFAALLLATPAFAIDGVIEINAARASAGGVTAGDTPGFPVTIDASGSYRLTSDLFVTDPNVDAIEVTAVDVSIDLNGFTIDGPTTCTGTPPAPVVCTPSNTTSSGIDATNAQGVAVRNGTIRDMPAHGIICGRRCRFEGVRAQGNGRAGLALSGGGIVERCHAEHNGTSGIQTGGGAPTAYANVVWSNTSVANGGGGISFALGDVVEQNVVRGNGSSGIAGHTGLVARNSVAENEFDGIHLAFGLVDANQVSGNGDHGLELAVGAVGAQGNAFSGNAAGDFDTSPIHLAPNACGNAVCP